MSRACIWFCCCGPGSCEAETQAECSLGPELDPGGCQGAGPGLRGLGSQRHCPQALGHSPPGCPPSRGLSCLPCLQLQPLQLCVLQLQAGPHLQQLPKQAQSAVRCGPGGLAEDAHLSLQVGYPGGRGAGRWLAMGAAALTSSLACPRGSPLALAASSARAPPRLGGVGRQAAARIILQDLLQTQGARLASSSSRSPRSSRAMVLMGGRRGLMRGCCLSFLQEGALGFALG